MENKGKIKKGKIITFNNSKTVKHFTPGEIPVNDVLGSYTGTPVDNGTVREDIQPTQDADDL